MIGDKQASYWKAICFSSERRTYVSKKVSRTKLITVCCLSHAGNTGCIIKDNFPGGFPQPLNSFITI